VSANELDAALLQYIAESIALNAVIKGELRRA